MRPYGRTSVGLRAAGAFVSLGLTVAMFLLLRAASLPAPPKKPQFVTGVVVFPLRRSPVAPAARAGPAPAATVPRRSAGTTPTRIALPSTAAAAEPAAGPAVASTLPATAAAPQAEAASAPLRIDAGTIARAIAASEGNVRRMARRGGAELETPRPSGDESLAASVADKGVADCLAPNAAGSLLSAPLILLRAINGRCK